MVDIDLPFNVRIRLSENRKLRKKLPVFVKGFDDNPLMSQINRENSGEQKPRKKRRS